MESGDENSITCSVYVVNIVCVYIILISYAHLIEIASQLINGLEGGVERMSSMLRLRNVLFITLQAESL